MCGGSVWDFERWRPFKQFLDDVDCARTEEA
jgi:hypothetical protein